MDTSDNARSLDVRGELLRHSNLRRELTQLCARWSPILGPEALAALVEAHAKGCRAVAFQVLREWGVR